MCRLQTQLGRTVSSPTTRSLPYDRGFFDYISIGSRRSAAIVAPLILKHYRAKSVADIGCGRGAWLTEWRRAGVADYIGVDGDYVDQDALLISPGRFVMHDLTKPFDIGRMFDLVVSLEVGEHIEPGDTETFVDNLCRHADAILFSAAVPGQGGVLHVNEQEYAFWRQRFSARGYRLFDFVRPTLRSQLQVEPWYRYNCLFFARADAVERLSDEAQFAEIKPDQAIPEYSSVYWRVRNAIIRRLPPHIYQQLLQAKHQFVRSRLC
jgi:SAM-dependent methyltransferase